MIKKDKLKANVAKVKNETADALTTVYNALNQGQQKKILKNEKVYQLLLRYGVISE